MKIRLNGKRQVNNEVLNKEEDPLIGGIDKKNYRIKEVIFYQDDKENHIYSPQFDMSSLDKDYTIDYHRSCGEDGWVYLSRDGFRNIEEARKACYDHIPHFKKYGIKYHEL